MTTRHRKLALNAAAVALWGTAGGLVAAGVWLPVDAAPPLPATGHVATRPTTTTAPFDFGELADLELRKPLPAEVAEAPKVPAVPAAVAVNVPPAVAVNLKGTVVEPGHAYAIFTTPAGGTELKRVGDRTGGAVVTAILDGAVTLEVGGRTVELRVPHPPAGVGGRP